VAAATLYFLRYCYRGYSVAKSVTKVTAIAPLVVFAVLNGGFGLLVVALLLCLLGDLMLSFDSDETLLAGIAAFAVGHVAYIWLFATHQFSELSVIFQLPYAILTAIIIVVGIFMASLLFKNAGSLRFAVLAYVPMIAGLGLAGLGFAESWMIFVTLGALLFVASDLVLGLEMFVLREGTMGRKLAPFWVWATYWSAQVLIVMGMT